jgi:hypothetical protein
VRVRVAVVVVVVRGWGGGWSRIRYGHGLEGTQAPVKGCPPALRW